MWVAGQPRHLHRGRELGLGVFCFAIGRPKDMEPLLKAYKAAIVNATPVGDYVNDNIMGVTNMLCMEDRTKAFETAPNMGMNYYSSLAYHWLDNVPRPKHLPEWPNKIPEPTPEQVEQLSAEGYIAVGDPTTAPARCSAGWTWASTSWTFSPHQHAAHRGRGELDGAVREVIPVFDIDPEHSTTRYRRGGGQAGGLSAGRRSGRRV